MSDKTAPAADDGVSFGPFRLYPQQKLLLEDDKQVRLGSRALDLLIALVEARGDLVGKDELVRKVWPDTFVDEGNLRVHLAVLRKALGDGREGARYIVNVPGRGYQFVAAVTRLEAAAPATRPADHLPATLLHIVGRADTVANVVAQLRERRFVSIVGAGGIGKTTVALAVAETVSGVHRDGARFVDLSLVTDPRFVPGALATVLGLAVTMQNPLPGLLAFLADKDMLIVLDNCEHVIEAAAGLAESLVRGAGRIHVLATSREPLRAEGERVLRLGPLELPPTSAGLTAAEALRFAAVQLFVERAAAIDETFDLSDADTALVIEICRRLDGIALAIELAAGRIDVFGLRGLAEHLDDRFRLLTQGRRTALPRHKTLAATVGWSYELLSGAEQSVFGRLGVMAGGFTLASAVAIAGDGIDEGDAVEAVVSLVGKSMIAAEGGRAAMTYRLLDTMRAYALHKLVASGAYDAAARRHAEHFRAAFAKAADDWEAEATASWLEAWRRQIGNLRAALDWAFGPSGDESIGVELTVAGAPLWFQLSLIDECRNRVERALAASAVKNDPRRRMQLNAALGWSLMYTAGHGRETGSAWAEALALAEDLGDNEYRLRALWGLWAGHVNNGQFPEALDLAGRFHDIAKGLPGGSERYIGHRMTGAALHFLGEQEAARDHIERMLASYVRPASRSDAVRFQFDQIITARITLARVLWLQGYADRALKVIEDNIAEAMALNHTLSICNALAQSACPVALLAGDVERADGYLRLLIDLTASEGLVIWRTYSACFSGELLLRRGEQEAGLRLLRAGVDELRAAKFVQYHTAFLGALAEGLGAAGHAAEALAAIDEALARADQNSERWCLAELLRIKGDILLLTEPAGVATATDELYVRALDLARAQGALSWELRAATGVARLRYAEGHPDKGRQALEPVYARFSEGFGTADLVAARTLLDALA